MAALDPTQEPEADEEGNMPNIPRSTLKIVRQRHPGLAQDEGILKLLANGEPSDEDDDDDEEEDEEEEDEPNGGPSDPAKSKKAKKAVALQSLVNAAQEDQDSDEDMGDEKPAKPNGMIKSSKGKQPATSSDDEDDEGSSDVDELDMDHFVVCTLDTERVS